MGQFAGPIAKAFAQNDLNKIVNTYIIQNFDEFTKNILSIRDVNLN